MFTKFKGEHPTDEEIWASLPQEVKDKILSGYVDAYHKREDND